jgi:membrane-associated phospholipid phosphatase
MDAHTLGYQVIQWSQAWHGQLLDWMAMGATFLGTEAFFLLFVPMFYWCVDKKHGVRLALVFLLSVYLNSMVKELFQVPRPDPNRVRVIWASSGGGYSFPSGHAQNAMVFWGWMGRRPPWRRRPLVLAGLVLAISMSRIYMGLHFPVDILGGWLLGGLLLAGLVAVDRRISREPRGWESKFLPWAGVLFPLASLVSRTHPLQAMVAGAMLGFCMGYMVETRWVGFSPEAPWPHQVAKLLLGWGIGACLGVAMRVTLPQGPLAMFAQYWAMGLWVSLGLPFLYHRLRPWAEVRIASR